MVCAGGGGAVELNGGAGEEGGVDPDFRAGEEGVGVEEMVGGDVGFGQEGDVAEGGEAGCGLGEGGRADEGAGTTADVVAHEPLRLMKIWRVRGLSGTPRLGGSLMRTVEPFSSSSAGASSSAWWEAVATGASPWALGMPMTLPHWGHSMKRPAMSAGASRLWPHWGQRNRMSSGIRVPL